MRPATSRACSSECSTRAVSASTTPPPPATITPPSAAATAAANSAVPPPVNTASRRKTACWSGIKQVVGPRHHRVDGAVASDGPARVTETVQPLGHLGDDLGRSARHAAGRRQLRPGAANGRRRPPRGRHDPRRRQPTPSLHRGHPHLSTVATSPAAQGAASGTRRRPRTAERGCGSCSSALPSVTIGLQRARILLNREIPPVPCECAPPSRRLLALPT